VTRVLPTHPAAYLAPDRGLRAASPEGQATPLDVRYRVARPADVPAMAALVNGFAAERLMLPKSPESIALAVDDFIVATDGNGRLLGCGGLHEYSPSLAELVSLAVSSSAHGLGIGRSLVDRVERLGRARGTAALLALTLAPAFFLRLGYHVVDRSLFPEKVGADCAGCARRAACREICVYRPLADAATRAA
jgi:amino-acid N-acetyltransferase